uniref:Uncharacterized protein n=1 Tax=Heterorhabditis bacteriophora TaxID=37862 RepID=A0A1I7WDK4_HETBA
MGTSGATNETTRQPSSATIVHSFFILIIAYVYPYLLCASYTICCKRYIYLFLLIKDLITQV